MCSYNSTGHSAHQEEASCHDHKHTLIPVEQNAEGTGLQTNNVYQMYNAPSLVIIQKWRIILKGVDVQSVKIDQERSGGITLEV